MVAQDSIRQKTIVGNSLSGLEYNSGGLQETSKILEVHCGPPFEILHSGHSYTPLHRGIESDIIFF